jgi:hypothetical protein
VRGWGWGFFVFLFPQDVLPQVNFSVSPPYPFFLLLLSL